ncbi:MAG: 30S ribosomal protein S21 [Candidatus Calescibacterium sp.]|nr:30S ribosomal protein S21 [Candidatus Calescibacterium sp.]MCX7734398.1 30S ribosomal protein S21 [bacterium]MDW8086838.1 30S ribosomal protein S21 [Candidatus Calescibacterium sp.]
MNQKPIIFVRNNLERALKALRRSFDNDIAPLLRRHQHYRSKSQIRKVKRTLRVLGTKRPAKFE